MKQIRIYYESLEQGLHYIKPIIDEVINEETDVVLVRRPKKAIDLNNGSISALLTMTTPDVLITGISEDIEYPLVLIEVTEAVTTEDHELQRTYGAIAAYLAGAYYLKLSGEKESNKDFGGAKYVPYSTPKIFIEEYKYEGYIIAKWETEKDNKYTLKRNNKFPSCPPEIPLFSITIQNAVKAFIDNNSTWYEDSLSNLKREESYKDYRNLINKATGVDELLESWTCRRKVNLNKLRYFVTDKTIAAKINRFSHAMDPDRGILTFISFFFSKNRDVFGIYALVRPRGNALMKQDMTNVELMKEKLEKALAMDKGGLPEWLIKEFINIAKKAKSLDDVFDFQSIWNEHITEITENKVVMTLAYFLDGIYLNHNGIKIVWDKRKLVKTNNKDSIQDFASHFKFKEYVKPTPITEIQNEVNEDEVTYSIVHKVLIPNEFKIISVSYPGAQGSGAVLPNPELGKAQPREYPDVIALPPNDSKIDVILNESKGMFAKSSIEKDVDKILLYKTDKSRKEALKETLLVAQVIDKNKQLKNIVVGVSFGVKRNSNTTWEPANVDFIFRIEDREKWSIGIFKQELRDLIKQIEGKTDFPKLYICNKNNI